MTMEMPRTGSRAKVEMTLTMEEWEALRILFEQEVHLGKSAAVSTPLPRQAQHALYSLGCSLFGWGGS